MRARWIAKDRTEERKHGFEHDRVNRRSRIEVEVNRVFRHVISGAVGCPLPAGTACLAGRVSRIVASARRPEKTVKAPIVPIAQRTPRTSAVIPASRAPSAYPPSLHK